ncbi:MAG: DUF3336 domain-containing protein, partial [Proteobacteria bacterium]|nr:DUF3336 domain-containing protein [Pseudomonadota bacterium]
MKKIYCALDSARSYEAWLAAAQEHDEVTGASDWRADETSAYYDAEMLKDHMRSWESLRQEKQGPQLAATLSSDLYRSLNDLIADVDDTAALAGTKHLVEKYFDAAEESLHWLAETPMPPVSNKEKLYRFKIAWKVFGQSALMLSGGATLGFHHLGVVKALLNQGLLPHILTGSSTGAMIAAGICTRTDEELVELFNHPEQMRLDGLLSVGVLRGLSQRAWLDPEQLYAVLQHNIGDMTFADAYRHSGRALNISVSPARARQKPRLLNHFTAHDLLVARAALASSALPGLFPPVGLYRRGADGGTVEYLPGEFWVDGSIHGDLPKRRLARLHNVNHTIVSQTNPHVIPFTRHHGQRGLRPAFAGLASATARSHGVFVTDLLRRLSPNPLRQLTEGAHALMNQDYRGDI